LIAAVEICIACDSAAQARAEALAARKGGADFVECCASMQADGLTPRADALEAAALAFGAKKGVMAMIRPRAGDFHYTEAEVLSMEGAIRAAAESGAHGAVFGVLSREDGRVDVKAALRLLRAARSLGLRAVFHRAFDAAPDPDEALDALADLGFDRVLTAGVPWGRGGSALDGLARLRRTAERAAGRIEVVIGGGVTPGNAATILSALPPGAPGVCLHAFSGVRSGGTVSEQAVRRLARAARRRPGGVTRRLRSPGRPHAPRA
jgi:copper homeostasis protein